MIPDDNELGEDEHFTDDMIKDFFKEAQPVAELMVNKHTLDILTNQAVITMLAGQLLVALANHDKDEVITNVHALHSAFAHSAACYYAMDGVLTELWTELFGENYIDHLFGDSDDSG